MPELNEIMEVSGDNEGVLELKEKELMIRSQENQDDKKISEERLELDREKMEKRDEMDEEFMRMLQSLRDEMQGPLRVTSGFRCEDHNQMVSTTGINGPHTLAKASDILVSGERAMKLFEKARQFSFS